MLQKVREQRPSYNNDARITSSIAISNVKLFYYQLFAKAYAFVGNYAQFVIVNSSWTESHISSLWNLEKGSRFLMKMFPPCNTTHLQAIPLNSNRREKVILSVGQFRPEKDHSLQLRSLKAFLDLGDKRCGWCAFLEEGKKCLIISI